MARGRKMFDEIKGMWLFERNPTLLKRFGFLLMAWRMSCPNVNIRSQLGWAHAWCVANPKKAPKKDYARFLNTWMQGEQKKSQGPIKLPAPTQEALKRQKEFEEGYQQDMTFAEMQEIRRKNMQQMGPTAGNTEDSHVNTQNEISQ